MAQINKYGFSGSDADAFVWFPGQGNNLIHLDTLHTISISVHEGKGQVRRLGQRGIAGLTRSMRSIAGSMIFVIVNDHPLRGLQNYDNYDGVKYGWSLDRFTTGMGRAPGIGPETLVFRNKLGTLLSPFNLLLRHVTEYPVNLQIDGEGRVTVDAAAELIVGIEFIDEGKVTSANDIYTEITYSYIAKDYKPFAGNPVGISGDIRINDAQLNNIIAENEGFEESVNAQIKAALYGGE